MRFLFFLIFTFFIACTPQVVKEANMGNMNALSIDDFFLLLPDEAFYINETYPILSKVERQKILKSMTPEQAGVLSSNFLMDTFEHSDSFLAFGSFANDEGISVCLKTWQRKDQSLVVGVNISYGDHCCDYSKLKLFHYKNNRFKEVTKKIFPKLKIEDFVPDIAAETKALLPAQIEHSIRFTPEDDFIEVSINHTPMVFDLEKDLMERELKLVWKDNRFWIEEK